MAEKEITVEDLRKQIGKEGPPVTVEIEKGMIRRFVHAVDDPNPLWRDEEYAKKTKHGGIIAPPYLLCAIMVLTEPTDPKAPPGFMAPSIPDMEFPQNVKGILDGGGEWEIYKPLKVGDVITSRTKLVNIHERQGKMGKMYFYIVETNIVNQRNEQVAKATGTTILYA
jgi:acyl dehydratase